MGKLVSSATWFEKQVKNKNLFLKLTLLIIGFFIGLSAMYIYLKPVLKNEGRTAREWEKIYNDTISIDCSSDDVKSILLGSPIKTKLNALDEFTVCSKGINAYQEYLLKNPSPTPTQIIKTEYINKTPSHKDLSSCTIQGNFYFCTDDNCFYNPNGTPTGECKVPPIDFKY